MKHYIFIKGQEIKHSVFGSRKGEIVSFYTIVEDYNHNKLNEIHFGETELLVGGTNAPIVFENGDFSLYGKHLIVSEWHDSTEKENAFYTKVLRNNNIELRIFHYQQPYRGEMLDKVQECFCWIEKDKMPIRLNNELITLGEFMKMTFDDNLNIVLSWDNGYSYCGSQSENLKCVYKHIERMFGKPELESYGLPKNSYHSGRIHCGELWGWHFGEKGEWILQTTTKNFRHSEISNS